MSWSASNLTRIHVTGTSLTQTNTATGDWAGRPGSLIDQLKARSIAFPPAAARTFVPARLGQTAPAAYAPLAQAGRLQVVTRYGVAGRVVAGLASDLPASVYLWNPDIVIIEICCNDFGGATNVTPGGAFQTSLNTVLDGIGANLPNAKVLVLSETVRGETVVAGPHFSDGTDTWAGNTRIQESCAARATYCEYVDVLTPALNYSAIYNPVGSSSTPRYLTLDSLHQTNLGSVVIANAVMQHLGMS